MQQSNITGDSLHSDIERLSFALSAAGIGTWDYRVVNGVSSLVWDERCMKLFGFIHTTPELKDFVARCIHKSDQERVERAVQKAFNPASGGGYDIKYKIIGVDDGLLRYAHFIGQAYFDEHGKVCRFSGIVLDITKELLAEEEQKRLITMIENSDEYMSIDDLNGEPQYLNSAGRRLLGISEDAEIRNFSSNNFYSEDFYKNTIQPAIARDGKWKGIITLNHFISGEEIPCQAYFTEIRDSENLLIGYGATLKDLRPELAAEKAKNEREAMFYNVTRSSPTGLWMSDAEGNVMYMNETLTELTGLPYEALLGNGWLRAIVEEDRQKSIDTFRAALATQTHYETEFRILTKNKEVRWCRSSGDPYYDENGYAGYVGYCMDIHERIISGIAIRQSEERFRSMVEQAPLGIALLRGRDMIIESANQSIFNIWRKSASVTGLPLRDALPELKDQGFLELLQKVYDTGIPYFGIETLVRLDRDGVSENAYFDFTYTPVKNAEGKVNGVMVIASEVTQQVEAKNLIAQSEERFRHLIEEAPVATAIFTGRELLIEIANDAMIRVWGKGNSVIGKPLREALPELEGQTYLNILEQIFETGKSFHAQEAAATLVMNGKPEIFYFNFTFQPLFDNDGNVYAILDMAIDVTNQVLSKNKIAEAEAQLRSAIETAELGTWQVYPITGEFICSKRNREWLGFGDDEIITPEDALACISDPDPFLNRIIKSIAPENKGVIDVEYRVTNRKTGRQYFMHTRGQAFFNESGEVYLIVGSTRDVTSQKNLEYELERSVKERTEELDLAIRELILLNENLNTAKDNLEKSNYELEQYAYVASHDLQEPLRKIKVFSNLLIEKKLIPTEAHHFFQRIIHSADRMNSLIKDLLDFSRVLRPGNMSKVNLYETVTAVVFDFELKIQEIGAFVNIGKMPVIDGIQILMNQLFYNLLSNSLKFIAPGSTPEIRIEAENFPSSELHKYPGLSPKLTYTKITFSDNGIGFSQSYHEQVFEIFKRLHTHTVFPGSGIGLSICKRIVEKHNGCISVKSEEGKGTTFTILLPIEQK